MPEYAERERFSGSWNGEEIRANRTWGGHRFTDQEVSDLLDGEMVVLENLVSTKTGNTYSVRGRLAHQTFTGDDGKEHKFVGFQPVDFAKTIPNSWAQHQFIPDEKRILEMGESLHLDDCINKAGRPFSCDITFDRWEGIKPDFGNRD